MTTERITAAGKRRRGRMHMATAGTVLCAGERVAARSHDGPRGEVYKCPVACTFATIVVRVYKATVYGVGQYGRPLRRNLDVT